MTLEERKAAAILECNKVMAWSIKETDKVIAHLKSEGKKIGLDGYNKEFSYIKEIVRQKVKKIFDKYNLPLKE